MATPTTTPDYDLRHPLFEALRAEREMSRDLFSGRRVVKAKREKYLFKLDEEESSLYDFRLKRATYENWPAYVITARQALLWRKEQTRDALDARVAQFVEDVDGSGKPAAVFFEETLEAAQVDGIAWVLVDLQAAPVQLDESGAPLLDGDGFPVPVPLTAQDEALLGRRPKFQLYPAEQVLDWDFDDDGRLKWAVVTYEVTPTPEPGMPRATERRWVVWRPDRWEVFKQTKAKDAKASREFVRLEVGRNTLGAVPLVPFYGAFERHGLGWPVISDVLDLTVSLYNKSSDRDMAEHLTNNPVPYVVGTEPPGPVSVSYGSGIFVEAVAGAPDPKVGYLEASGRGIEASRLSEQQIVRRIVEIATSQTRRDTAQVQSAESQKMERRYFSASLSAVARNAEQSENTCWKYALGWLARGADAGRVVYNTDFDDELIEAAYVAALSGVVDKRQLSRETFWKILRRGEVLPDDWTPEAERRAIEDDVDSLSPFGPEPSPNPTAEPAPFDNHAAPETPPAADTTAT